MIVSREDQAPSVNDTGALWVSDLWEKIVAGRVGHTGDTTLAAKKADRFGFPPLASQITKNAQQSRKTAITMSGVLDSAWDLER